MRGFVQSGFLAALTLAGLVGSGACYAPHAVDGVPCASSSSAVRCPFGQVCIARSGTDVCEPEGTLRDVDATIASDALGSPDGAGDWWNGAWADRRPVDITAGTNGAPAGYSIAVTFDHATLVASGEALLTGDDVRIVGDDAGEIERVLDSGSSWNLSTTTLWFRTTAALAPGQTVRYWLYHGNPLAGTAPADASAVFLISDGFEGSLAAWSRDAGVSGTSVRAHRGTHSMVVPMQNQTIASFSAQALDEQDVAFDLWWNLESTTNIDAAQGVRANANSSYFTDLEPAGTGSSTWDIAKTVAGNFEKIVPSPAGSISPSANTWIRVTVYAYHQTMAIDIDSTRYVPASGFAAIDATTSGTVRASVFQSSGRSWFDDATVRRLVVPEPTVVLGAEQPH